MGENVIGRYMKGNPINCPIETVDSSVDMTHCVITVKRDFELASIRADVACEAVLRYLRRFDSLPDHTDNLYLLRCLFASSNNLFLF